MANEESINEFVSQTALKQLDELKIKIDAAAKSMEALIADTVTYNNQISSSTGIKQFNDTVTKAKPSVDALEAATAKLNKALSEEAKAVAIINAQISAANKANKDNAQAVLQEGSAYAKLVRDTQAAEKAFLELAAAEGILSKSAVEAQKRHQALFEELKKIQQGAGNFRQSVGNYTTGFQSFSQVLREAPAFAVNANTGFLALSNNLPILADELKRAREAGQSFGQILKGLAGTLFSFGGVITILTTLLTFLPDIIKFFGSLDNQANNLDKSLANLAKTSPEVSKELGKMGETASDIADASIDELDQAIESLNDKLGIGTIDAASKATGALQLLRDELPKLSESAGKALGLEGAAIGVPGLSFLVGLFTQSDKKIQAVVDNRRKQNEIQTKLDLLAQRESQVKDKERTEDAKKEAEKRAKDAAEANKKRLEDEKEFNEQMAKFDEERLRIRSAAQVRGIDLEKIARDKAAKEQSDALEGASIEAIDTTKKTNDLIAKINKDTREKQIEEAKTFLLENAGAITDAIFSIVTAGIDRQKNAIQEQIDQSEELKNAEIDRIESLAASEEEKAARIAVVNAKAQADKERLEAKQRELDKKKAIADKQKAVFDIILNTAIAVVKALPNVFLSVAAGVIGAAQLAAVLAQPIPKFAKGTDYSPEGMAYVGERGQELIVTPSGQRILTPNSATLTYLERGSKVIPNHKLNSMALDGLTGVSRFNSSSSNDFSILAKATNDSADKITKAIKSQTGTIITEGGLYQQHLKAAKLANYLKRNLK